MTQTDYTTRVLHADEGHFLTQAGEVALSDRVVTDTVYLASTDSPSGWREITADEADAIRQAQHEAAQAAIPEEIRQRIQEGQTAETDSADGE